MTTEKLLFIWLVAHGLWAITAHTQFDNHWSVGISRAFAGGDRDPGNRATDEMPDRSNKILKRWLHSHEEDTATEMVFRDSSFAFPPSRGRAGFELNADGTYIDVGIAPADGILETEGRWSLKNDLLTLSSDAHPAGRRELRIVECDEDRLVIKQ